jgi:putative inorganic carbon (hco3(-)) transporter
VEQTPKPAVTRSRRREPLGFAYFGLILFMVVYFARPEDWIPGLSAVPLAKITGILILLALAFSFNQIRWHMPPEAIFLAVLVAQLWLAAVFSPVWRGGAVNVMLDFSKVLPLLLVIYGAVRSMNRLRNILWVQAASVAAIAFVSILHGHVREGRLQGVLSGIYGNSNDLALANDLALPVCLALALLTKRMWMKIAWAIAMLAMIYAVALTASRAGAMALAVAALVCLWQLGVRQRRYYLLLLAPLAVVAVWFYGGSSLEQRFAQTSIDSGTNKPDSEAEGSALQRKELLFRSLEVTATHPLLGIGPGNFPIISGNWHVTHNSYTQISAEGGILALVLYLLILWRAAANLSAVRKYSNVGNGTRLFSMALAASFSAYLVGSFFGSDAYLFFPYCLVAYTTALRLIVRRSQGVPSAVAELQSVAAPVEVHVWE